MNYKRIIRNQEHRLKILKALRWVPDEMMVRLQYRIQLGFWPNLKNPKRYTEKLQVYKLKYRNPVMHQCVDKYDVREYVKSKGLGHILNDCYGVYDRAEDIDLATLPEQFVAKTTDGTGGFNIKIVTDKSKIDKTAFRAELNSWLGKKDINAGREWAYTGIKKSRIVIEKFLSQRDGKLLDYKFFCFNGKARFLYVSQDLTNENARCTFLDIEWNKMPVQRLDYPALENIPAKPDNFEQMKKVAKKLAEDFPHVRVDLYNIEGQIVFGEFTFYNASGYMKLNPDSYDNVIGDMFDTSEFL